MQRLAGKFNTAPLYMQVAEMLADRIAKGEWGPGVMLPAEQELARDLEVSNGTIRKAMLVLLDNQLIRRRQGRGTYVLDKAKIDADRRVACEEKARSIVQSCTRNGKLDGELLVEQITAALL